MKKGFVLITLPALVLVLVLSACAAKASTSAKTTSGSSSSTTGRVSSTTNNQPLALPAQLVVGTLKLEGTTNAVDAQEAVNLIPLWQAYTQLISSNTAAQAEIDAVVSQIQTTMTPVQLQAITAMKLTSQDEYTTISSMGLGYSGGANGTPGFSGTPRAGGGFAGGGAGFTGGGAAGGGFGGVAGGTTGASATRSPGQIATLQAARAQSASRIPTSLMN